MFGFFRPKESDLRQAIEQHLKDVSSGAPIRGILSSPEIKRQLEAFDHADARALGKQRRHWRAGRLARLAGLLGVLIVPLELLPIEQWLPPWSPFVVNVLRAVTLILTFVAIILLGLRRSAVKWKQARCEAERARGELFRSIIIRAGSDAAALAGALACFKTAHLDWQIGFYDSRTKQLPKRIQAETSQIAPFQVVGIVLSVGAAILGLVTVLNFLATHGYSLPYLSDLLPRFPDPTRWQHGLHATAASLLAFAGARFLTHEDISNAALYPWALTELERIKGADLPRAEAAAVSGDRAAVLDFCARVQRILDTEHAVWAAAIPGASSQRQSTGS